jgi:hypothetical protein
MIAPIVSALFVSAAGIAATAGLLSGVLSLFQKHIKPRDDNRGTGAGTGTGGGASGSGDYYVRDLKPLDLEISRPGSGEPRGAGAGT